MMKAEHNGQEYYRLYIDGQWVDSSSAKLIEVQNPANEEVIGRVSDAAASDVQKALESSEKAQLQWQRLPAVKRAAYLVKLVEKVKEKRDFLARLLVLEQGKTYGEALGEVDDTMAYMMYAAESANKIKGDILPSNREGEILQIRKVPYGVTIGLCAWNYPLALLGRKLGPALVTGNTMIIKPHELTPIASAEFFNLIHEAGFPPGVANFVTGTGAEVGQLLVSSPITKLVTVTGSVRAGQQIYKAASDNITALSLELGGKAPFIVLEDADIDKAAEAAVSARFANCGQVCVCSEMVLVHEKVADEFTAKLLEHMKSIKVGDPFDPSVTMGPKANGNDLIKIDDIVQETVAQGASIAWGGKRPSGGIFDKGYWYEPTILVDVKPDMAAAQKEIFGPVLPIVRISSFEEAIDIVNASELGLSAYLFTNDMKKMMHGTDVLQVGTVFLNQGMSGCMQGYHSGHKLSGLGGEDGEYGLEGYLQKRTIYMNYL
ncbi:aldehyde dehydrogenase [Paenibacillus sp. F411]|uniref:3-sulfolactaldehyde dehydrogenase n=1 Tax=Paenibacillus algicola TaxID=2565926 RepID=A0A4P8XSM2_9BACL|nr:MULTISPECIES: aldehyde dehydrogenase [Paenibacillus]MBO2942392.1 aldehyde dehydrogenase [Paenibacillus sp. F411]QCT03659.1 betaine-aldehyde dehydrogenase [Paenibacillus algicola]